MTLRQVDNPTTTSGGKRRGLFSSIEATPRTSLFFFAIVLELAASAVAGVAFVLNEPPFWIAGSLLWVAWFVLIFFILNPTTDRILKNRLGMLKRSALGIFISLAVMGLVEFAGLTYFHLHYGDKTPGGDFIQLIDAMNHSLAYNDGTALSHQATNNLLAGKNPYAHANIITALLDFNGSFDRVTPLRVGQFSGVSIYPNDQQLLNLWNESIKNPAPPPPELVSSVCYPAGSFLLPAPFIALGIKDIRIVYLLFALAALVYTAWQIPKQKRLIFIGAALISLELWNSIADGETGTMCFALGLVAWVALRKNIWLSGAFMGLAVTAKQTAWFFLPFYLILLFRTVGWRKSVSVTALVAGIFFATNLPFIIMDPNLWFSSMAAPMTDPMFPLGVGAITLVTSGLLDVRSFLPFTVAEVLVLAVALIWYFRNSRRYPHYGPILAVLPLFFAWRSLWSYFYYMALIALAGILLVQEGKNTPLSPDTNPVD